MEMKKGLGIGREVGGKNGNHPITQDQDTIKVSNCAQPMGDHQQRSICKLLPDTPLDQRVGVHVHGRCCFVEDHDAWPANNCTSETEELTLSLSDGMVAEFGTPRELWEKGEAEGEKGMFRAMCEESGEKEKLRAIVFGK